MSDPDFDHLMDDEAMLDDLRPTYCPQCWAVLQEGNTKDGQEILYCIWCGYAEAA